MSDSTIYLDYAAATPLDPRVLAAMEPYFAAQFYNPSATYLAAQDAHRALEAARAHIAARLGARAGELICTAGGTEANNVAIHGIMRRYPQANVVVSAIEHDSVRAPARRYEAREAAVTADGVVVIDDVLSKIDDRTVLVSVMYANNEVGTIQPIREIAQRLKEVRQERQRQGNDTPLFFHTDACQAANYLDLHVARLGVDLLSLNGGKLYGPKQTGVLYVRGGVRLQPLIDGGGQERGLRSGTENVAGAVGLAAALELAQAERPEEVQRLKQLQQNFFDRLEAQLPDAVINGSRHLRLPGNVHVTFPGEDNERLLFALDERGIQAAAGSACSAGNEEPSHVLRAMGLSAEEARASLRFTLGRATTEADIERTMAALRAILAH